MSAMKNNKMRPPEARNSVVDDRIHHWSAVEGVLDKQNKEKTASREMQFLSKQELLSL